MALIPHNKELLEGHDSRMKIVNISKYITEYKLTDKVKQMIPNKEIIDNFIVMVMVFIMDHTLGNDRKCSLSMISDFLEDISEPYQDDCQIDDFDELARFIVVGILQNNGKLNSFSVYDPKKERITSTTIRLVDEEAGSYRLTTDGCDYLFRTHELAVEMQYSVTKFMLKEHLKRENYNEALEQSRELISTLRNIINMMSEFYRRCKENINTVTVDQYDNMMARFYSVTREGYDELRSIQESADEKAKELQKAIEIQLDMETKKHVLALEGISRNIGRAIAEMRALINKSDICKNFYKDDIYNGFAANFYDRLSFDDDIMNPLEKGILDIDSVYQFLRLPLLDPEIKRIQNLESFYAVQEMIADTPDEIAEDIDIDISEDELVKIRNARFLDIIKGIFAYMKGREQFKASEFVKTLSKDVLQEYCEEKFLFQVFQSLYSLGYVSISEWKESTIPTPAPNGEFDLSSFLKELSPELLEMDSFTVVRTNDEFTVNLDYESIKTNELIIEVKKV